MEIISTILDRLVRHHLSASGIAFLVGLTALVGCHSPNGPPIQVTGFQSQLPAERVVAIRLAARQGDLRALPHLVDRLDDEDPAVRFAAILALERLTGQRMGYRYGAPASERARWVNRWRHYMATSKTKDADLRNRETSDGGSDSGG